MSKHGLMSRKRYLDQGVPVTEETTAFGTVVTYDLLNARPQVTMTPAQAVERHKAGGMVIVPTDDEDWLDEYDRLMGFSS